MDLTSVIGHGDVKKMMERWVKAPGFAYLFSGPAHVGKALLAERLVRGFADHDLGRPLDTHPDIIISLPEEGKKEIGVKSLREARNRLYQSAQAADRVVMFIPKLDWLNQAGFNTLLKVMEEPPAGAVFVTVAEQLSAIPATILSRVVHVPLGIVPRQELEDGLVAFGRSPEEAKMLAEAARGRPGLAVSADTRTEYREAAMRFVMENNLGRRLAAVDEIRQKVETGEDQRAEWTDALATCMDAIRENMARDRKKALILGQGVIDAYRALNGPVGPRVMLEGAAVLARQERLELPSAMPGAYPLSLR
ncbi:AAA family ATPase [Candidatus Uhrbacteria bacterium]|nr:AAA family ATPase [Candidatus Uhrbacteria bacterium]